MKMLFNEENDFEKYKQKVNLIISNKYFQSSE